MDPAASAVFGFRARISGVLLIVAAVLSWVAWALVLVGAIGVRAFGLARHLVVLGFFGAFGLAFVGMGLPLVRRPRSAHA